MPDEAIAELRRQEDAAERLRGRSIIVFGSAVLATTFLAGQILPLSLVSGAAVTCFFALGVVTFIAVSSIPGSVRTPTLEELESTRESGSQIRGRLRELDAANRRILDRLVLLLQLAIVLVTAEVLLWVLDISRIR